MLKLKNIKKKHGKLQILNGLSLEMKKGEIGVLLGRSGAGKSTLLRILANLDKADSGDIKQDSATPAGIVFQEYHLFENLSAQKNIALPLNKVIKLPLAQANERAKELLAQYQLEAHGHHSPSQLSGGQKQRLAIARSLAMNPSILCMDEPTSALDPKQSLNVIQIVKRLAKEGKTILVATHDPLLLEAFDCTIYLMDNGKLVESTSSSAFFANRTQFKQIDAYLSGF